MVDKQPAQTDGAQPMPLCSYCDRPAYAWDALSGTNHYGCVQHESMLAIPVLVSVMVARPKRIR